MHSMSAMEIVLCTPGVQGKLFCAFLEYEENCSMHSWSTREIVPRTPGVREKIVPHTPGVRGILFSKLLELFGALQEYMGNFSTHSGGHKRLFHAFRSSKEIFPTLQMNRSKKLFPTLSRNSKKLFLTLSRSSKKLLLTHSRNSKKLFTTLSRSS